MDVEVGKECLQEYDKSKLDDKRWLFDFVPKEQHGDDGAECPSEKAWEQKMKLRDSWDVFWVLECEKFIVTVERKRSECHEQEVELQIAQSEVYVNHLFNPINKAL